MNGSPRHIANASEHNRAARTDPSPFGPLARVTPRQPTSTSLAATSEAVPTSARLDQLRPPQLTSELRDVEAQSARTRPGTSPFHTCSSNQSTERTRPAWRANRETNVRRIADVET